MKHNARAVLAVFAILALLFLIPMPVFAAGLRGEGWGKTPEEAKSAALADLSTLIQVQVESDFVSVAAETNGRQFNDVKSVVRARSSLPILGAEFSALPSKDGARVAASLDPAKSLGLYDEKLKDMARAIEDALKAANSAESDTARHEALGNALPLFDQYSRHKTVAFMLGMREFPAISRSEADIRGRMYGLEQAADSIAMAAKILARGMDQERIFIHPPTARSSREVTPFAAAVRDNLAGQLRSVASPSQAAYILTGSYEKTASGMDISCALADMRGITVKSAVARLSPKAYEGYETEPRSLSLERLIRDGVAVSSDFRVELATGLGGENPLFRVGDEMELLVKSSRPAYFYIVGHVDRKDGRYSYLLDLNEADGASRFSTRFVRFINADDANKWVSLGRFEVSPPFGVENYQLIASTADISAQVPPARIDTKTGFYVVAGKPEDGVSMTRALKPKRETGAITTEAALTITTMGK